MKDIEEFGELLYSVLHFRFCLLSGAITLSVKFAVFSLEEFRKQPLQLKQRNLKKSS